MRKQPAIRVLLAALLVGLVADYAFADGFFGFRFFNDALATLFLLPFQIAGCG